MSITGICGFVLPNRDLAQAVRVWRFGIGILGMAWGILGVVLGILGLVLHLASIRSLGIPYWIPTPAGRGILRRRLVKEKSRDRNLGVQDKRNQR